MPINQAVWRFSFVSLSLSLSLCHRRRHHSRSNENQLTHPTPGGTNDAVDLASINTRRWLHWRYKTRWKTIRYCFVCFFLVINWSFCWRRSASPVGSVWRRRPRSLPCTSWSPSKAIRNETIQVNCHWFFHCVQSERLIFIEKKKTHGLQVVGGGPRPAAARLHVVEGARRAQTLLATSFLIELFSKKSLPFRLDATINAVEAPLKKTRPLLIVVECVWIFKYFR